MLETNQVNVTGSFAHLTRNVEVVGSSPSKAPIVSKKLYPHC